MIPLPDGLHDEKELAILQALEDGAEDVRDIRQATTLSNSEVNFRLAEMGETLADRGLVKVGASSGRIRVREHDQLREYTAPKPVALTAKGKQGLAEADSLSVFEEMN